MTKDINAAPMEVRQALEQYQTLTQEFEALRADIRRFFDNPTLILAVDRLLQLEGDRVSSKLWLKNEGYTVDGTSTGGITE